MKNKHHKNKTRGQKPYTKPHTKTEERARKTSVDRANLYGFHAVHEAWLNPERNIQTLYMNESAQQGFEKTLTQAKKQGLERPVPTIIDKKSLEKILPQGAVHQGLALETTALDEFSTQDLIIKTQGQERPLLLILDQLTDPHNVGAILRSACAFGVSGLIMQKKHAPILEGVLAKTACGAIEHVPVALVTNLSRTIEELQQEGGYFVYGLDERGEMDIAQIGEKPGKTALVLGAEGPGIRHNVKEHCDALVRLPMHGPMPSINVSNAAAVALYAVTQGGK